MHVKRTVAGIAATLTLVAGAFAAAGPATASPRVHDPSLRKVAPHDLKIGSATWGTRDLTPYHRKSPTQYQQLLASQFNSVTPENDLKWENVHPTAGMYDFSGADAVVAFARANNQEVRGHTLLWHSQNAKWVMDAYKTWTCAQAKAVLKAHVTTVVGRYRGKIYEWDVANEIFHDTWDAGGVRLRTDQNPFLYACAADPVGLIADAFRWAHAADPKAVLFMNDYAAEGINAKTDAYYALAKQLLARGVPIGGFGAQAHLDLDYGFDTSLQANFERFAGLGLKVAITEADVRMRVDAAGSPLTASDIQLAATQFGQLLDACLNVPACSSFTLWQFTDAKSWVPGWFAGKGYATPWTSEYETKPSYDTLLTKLTDAKHGRSPRKPVRR